MGTVSNRMVKKDPNKKECDRMFTQTKHKSHDSNHTENWRKKLETNFHCVSAIYLLPQSTKEVDASCDDHIHHF